MHARADDDGDGAAHGVTHDHGARGIDNAAGDELVREGVGAGGGAREVEWAGRAAVAGKIGDEDTEMLQSEGVREVRHDFLVSGEAVEEDDRALGVVAGVEDVGDHAAAAGVDDDGVAPEMRAGKPRDEEADNAE